MIYLIIIVFALIIAGYAIFSGFKYTRMISNIFMGLVYRPSDSETAARGEKVAILDSSGEEIRLLHLSSNKSKKILIFCHESGSDENSWEKYCYFFPELGFHILSVDLRDKNAGSGKNSLSQWPHQGEVGTLLTVLRWAKKAVAIDAEVVFFGVSKGADLALAVSFLDPSIKAVITDGLFSMKEIFRDYIRKWAPILVKPNFFGEHYPGWVVNIFSNLGYWHCQKRSGRKFVDTEKLLKRSHRPLFMIHGEKDDYVPSSHQRLLEKILKKNKKSRVFGSHRLVALEARHNEAVLADRVRYESQVRDFVERYIQ